MAFLECRTSILAFCLLVLNGAAVALGALPHLNKSGRAFQVLQMTLAGGAFILTLFMPCFVLFMRGRGEFGWYLLIAVLDIVASVCITLRWVNNNLRSDYDDVPRQNMVIIMVVAVSWAASLAAGIGVVFAIIGACSRIRRERKNANIAYNPRLGVYDQRIPPQGMSHAPPAVPFTATTYDRPPNSNAAL